MCLGINGLTNCAPIADWIRRGVPLGALVWCSRRREKREGGKGPPPHGVEMIDSGAPPERESGRAVKALPYQWYSTAKMTLLLASRPCGALCEGCARV